MVGPIMNLINETHYSCERREHVFMIFREYIIIFPFSIILFMQANVIYGIAMH